MRPLERILALSLSGAGHLILFSILLSVSLSLSRTPSRRPRSLPRATNGLSNSPSLSLHTARNRGHAAAEANARRDGFLTFANKVREQARVQADAAHARLHAAQCELKRKWDEEDGCTYDEKVQTWKEELAKQKAHFARKASKPISKQLTCTLCGKSVPVCSQEVEAWECHVKCGRRRTNGV